MYQSVLVLIVLRVVRCRLGVSLWPTSWPSWTPVTGRVLREALKGPLSGHQVMLMVDDDVKRSLSLDLLLSGLPSPTAILRTPPDTTDGSFTIQQFALPQGMIIVVLFCVPLAKVSPPPLKTGRQNQGWREAGRWDTQAGVSGW